MRMFLECGHERIFISNMLSVEQWEKNISCVYQLIL